ncbi:hypothetical protein ABK040_014295 [Willaertia magna]
MFWGIWCVKDHVTGTLVLTNLNSVFFFSPEGQKTKFTCFKSTVKQICAGKTGSFILTEDNRLLNIKPVGFNIYELKEMLLSEFCKESKKESDQFLESLEKNKMNYSFEMCFEGSILYLIIQKKINLVIFKKLNQILLDCNNNNIDKNYFNDISLKL